MKNAAILAGLMIIILAMLATTPAQPPPSAGEIDRLVKELGSDQFRVRAKAMQQLIKQGRKIEPALRGFLKRKLSLEARLRIERILQLWQVSVRVVTNRKEFDRRLKGKLHLVDFDDVDTRKEKLIAIDEDRYLKKFGIRIRGTVGQFVGRSFDYPNQFRPVSAPNMYAPGPRVDKNAGAQEGGHNTTITFFDNGRRAAVAAFGVYFIDADQPVSGITAFDKNLKQLGKATGFRGPDGSQLFRGLIAADGQGTLVPIISVVHLVNGASWPTVDRGEGVTLDDFVFSPPASSR